MTVFLPRPRVRVCIVSVQKLLGDGSSHHYKDLSEEMVAPVYQGSGVKLLGDGSSHHYKDPSEEMVAPVFQGSGVKLLGDGSSHHYKDPSERGEEARDGCTCISRIWG